MRYETKELCAKTSGTSYVAVTRTRDVMDSQPRSNSSVVELKIVLRERNLPTGGTKASLIERLSSADPYEWVAMCQHVRPPTPTAVERDIDEIIEDSGSTSWTQTTSALREETATLARDTQDSVTHELMLLRREKDLWKRERRLLQRELEIARAPSATSVETISSNPLAATGGVGSIKDLLSQFNAMDGTFWKWKRQFELLREAYQLNDNSARTLISSRLKGKALFWFYSKPEYVIMSIKELLTEMGRMFDLHQNKLTLRKEFETRMCR